MRGLTAGSGDVALLESGVMAPEAMRAMQTLLFPDARPLVERLGREFFRALPERAGVYLMRGADGAVLYVGKAKNLRKRLSSYRVANPERLRRRHLRLLGAVVRIEVEECEDEAKALEREAELLQVLKPRYNRAGTWRGPVRYLVWREAGEGLEVAVTGVVEGGWRGHGPIGAVAGQLHVVLARLLWVAVHPVRGYSGLPLGWADGAMGQRVAIEGEEHARWLGIVVDGLFSGRPEVFVAWIFARLTELESAFDRAAVGVDLERLLGALPVVR